MLDGENLGNALSEAMKLKGVTQDEVALHFGVKQPSVSEWISTGRIAKKRIPALVEYFRDVVTIDHWGLPKNWDPNAHNVFIDGDEFAIVRRADVIFANGIGKVSYFDDEKPPLVFRREFLSKLGISEGNAVVVEASGHSNLPKIPENSVVLVNRGDRTRLDGQFFAFRAGEHLLVKRLERIKDVGILATAENSDFKPKTVLYRDVDAEQLEVIGRVVWFGATI